MAKESQGKPERRRRTAGSIGGNQKGQRKKEELEACFDDSVRCCDEAEAAQEQKSLVEQEIKQCFENVQSNMGVCGEKDRSCHRKSLAKPPRQGRDDKSVDSMQISIKRRRAQGGVQRLWA